MDSFNPKPKNSGEVARALGIAQVGETCWQRHPLAFLVEAADGICYSIIDLEDGCRLGLLSFDEAVDLLGGILGVNSSAKIKVHYNLNEQLGVLRMAIHSLLERVFMGFLDNESGNNNFNRCRNVCIGKKSPMSPSTKFIVPTCHGNWRQPGFGGASRFDGRILRGISVAYKTNRANSATVTQLMPPNWLK